MPQPPLYKYLDVQGAKLTLGNRTFKHSKPSDFNDTEDLTIQSIFPEDLETALKRASHSILDVIAKNLDAAPSCPSPMRERLAAIQAALRVNPAAIDRIREEVAKGAMDGIYDLDRLRATAEDLSIFQRAFHPEVPMFASPQQGARINVWPSFFENQLRNNKREIRRKRIQLVHSGKRHVSLFVKNVAYRDFLPVAQPLLEPGMSIGAEGKTWQSIQIQVPEIDPLVSVQSQADRLDEVFKAVRRLYDFFEKNQAALLGVPIS